MVPFQASRQAYIVCIWEQYGKIIPEYEKNK